ncbi:SDR family NAD(P)-dependent oxidoreductase [Sulfurihydrogenibium yellowstonense]|uniref:Short-chain dehydrogenase/reductase SDR n=1 Tax=Sulfurihydrogenibium yellowstonense SS-5 TaxID=432331 RepID=C4FIX8_9AQUI|nr:SDR family NAD(P)-dependent oxidoreductase [Sulfurihydrogenibium yellowstonense]EEP60966.1 short-chain dehydrogenase/reductase SDR [Sulfurihydrogenibium yellowstonense SS-5]
MDLKGKNALITGGSKRIGRDIVLGLAEHGCNVLIHYNSSKEEAEKVLQQAKSFGIKAEIIRADLLDENQLISLVNQSLNIFGHIDILINNASIYYKKPLEEATFEDLEIFYKIHIKAPFYLSKEFGKIMYERKEGRIINIIDYSAILPYKDFTPYSISKGGMITMTKAFAKEFAPYVLVNGILPGPIIPADGLDDIEKPLQKTLIKKWAGGKEVFKAVKYLIETDFTTGALIPVEGGRLIF